MRGGETLWEYCSVRSFARDSLAARAERFFGCFMYAPRDERECGTARGACAKNKTQKSLIVIYGRRAGEKKKIVELKTNIFRRKIEKRRDERNKNSESETDSHRVRVRVQQVLNM